MFMVIQAVKEFKLLLLYYACNTFSVSLNFPFVSSLIKMLQINNALNSFQWS